MRDDVGEVAEKVDAARQIHEFSVRGEKVGRLALGNVPLDEKEQAQFQTGRSWSRIIGADGIEPSIWNMHVLMWLARRASGEPQLLWSTYKASIDDTVRMDEVELPVVDPDDDGDADPQP